VCLGLGMGTNPESGNPMIPGGNARGEDGRKELACGGQAFRATSLFDPSI
jgi:hypothetical protein